MVIGDIHLRSFAEDGAAVQLAATLYLPPLSSHERVPGLIVGHGAGSRRGNHDEFCRVACLGGFAVLALDFRGHGDSGGQADGPLERDILSAADHLRGLPFVDAERICYRGSSMGGFYGLKSAAEARFAALVLLCPASEGVILEAIDEAEKEESARTTLESSSRERRESPREATGESPGDSTGPAWDRDGLRRYFLAEDSLLLAAGVQSPVLIVHARADEVVPFEHSLHLTEALAGPATLMALPGGSHTSAQHDGEVHRQTLEWLRSCSAAT